MIFKRRIYFNEYILTSRKFKVSEKSNLKKNLKINGCLAFFAKNLLQSFVPFRVYSWCCVCVRVSVCIDSLKGI